MKVVSAMIASITLKAASGFLLALVMLKLWACKGEVVLPFHDGITAMSHDFIAAALVVEFHRELMPELQATLIATLPDAIEPPVRRVLAKAVAVGA